MRIGTTPTHIFELPFETSTLKGIEITYSLNDVVILRKLKEDCETSGNTISVKLSQEDTLKFKQGFANIQLRVITPGDDIIASDIFRVLCEKCLSSEVLV